MFRHVVSLRAVSGLTTDCARLASTAAATESYLPPARAKNVHLHKKDVPRGLAPKPVRLAEAFKQGQFKVIAGNTNAHAPVPKTAKEYFKNRVHYNRQLSHMRWEFAWEDKRRRFREAAAARQERAAIEQEAVKRKEARLGVTAQNILRNEQTRAVAQERLRALQEVRRGKREAYFAKVDKKRGEWLQKLNAEAQTWIAQADIDKRITAELFEMTRPWQYDAYYANAGLKSVDNVAHEEGWESDIEEGSIDMWEPLERALNTGIQLDELQAQKRMDTIISDIEKMKAEYQAKHSEFFTPEMAAYEGDPAAVFTNPELIGEKLELPVTGDDGTEDLNEVLEGGGSAAATVDDDDELDAIVAALDTEETKRK